MTRSKTPQIKNGKQVMNGVLASVLVVSGEKLLLKLAKHPLLVFCLGMVGGFVVYKNRESIMTAANKTIDTGKNFVLEQKEKALDLIAEAKEGG